LNRTEALLALDLRNDRPFDLRSRSTNQIKNRTLVASIVDLDRAVGALCDDVVETLGCAHY